MGKLSVGISHNAAIIVWCAVVNYSGSERYTCQWHLCVAWGQEGGWQCSRCSVGRTHLCYAFYVHPAQQFFCVKLGNLASWACAYLLYELSRGFYGCVLFTDNEDRPTIRVFYGSLKKSHLTAGDDFQGIGK